MQLDMFQLVGILHFLKPWKAHGYLYLKSSDEYGIKTRKKAY